MPHLTSSCDKEIYKIVSRPLTEEELKGFSKIKPKPPRVMPYVDVSLPSKSEGKKGLSVEIGIKGTF